MSDPPTLPDSDIPDRDPVAASREGRPVGESGGHTVQEWEQTLAGRRATLSDAVLSDDPSPPTTPLYLRSHGTLDTVAEPAFDARAQTLAAQTGALIDSLTRGFAEALAEAMRPVVSSTVSQLLPMLLKLGSVPDDDVEADRSDSSPEPDAT